MPNFVNLTPHALTVLNKSGEATTFEPSGVVPRVSKGRVPAADLGDFMVNTLAKGEVTGMPDPVEGTVFVVSGMVLEALGGTRPDVVAPDTDKDPVRNDKGHVVAVRGFVNV